MGKAAPGKAFGEHVIPLQATNGTRDLILVARHEGAGSTADKPLGLHWVRFEPDAESARAIATSREKAKPLVRVATAKATPGAPVKPWKLADFTDKDLETVAKRDGNAGEALLTRLGCVG